MALTYTGTAGVFTRIGCLVGELNRVVSAYGLPLNSGVEAIWDKFPNSDEDAVAIDGIIASRDQYRGVHGSYINALRTAMNNALVEQVNRQASTALPTKTVANALSQLKTDMIADSATVHRPTLSAAVTAGSANLGNAVLQASTTNEFGDPCDMAFAEAVKFTCTNDVSGGATQYAEPLSFSGAPAYGATDYRWPGGSGCAGTLNVVDASTAGLLTDGGFEQWNSSTVPTYWSVTTGGSTVSRSASNTVRGTYSLAITSDGSTLTSFRQQLSSTLLKPNTVYCFNAWMMMSSADGSGAVRVRLTNSAGTTIANDASTSQTYSRDTNGQIGTSLTNVTTFFQTPRQLPTSGGVYLVIEFTTAPANTKILYVDHVGFAAATRLYNGGPFVCAFSKDTATAVRDTYSLAVTNSFTYNSFVRALDRWVGMRDAGVYLPSASSPSISDSLIP